MADILLKDIIVEKRKDILSINYFF